MITLEQNVKDIVSLVYQSTTYNRKVELVSYNENYILVRKKHITIKPTGLCSISMGMSHGIEPVYQKNYERRHVNL